MIQITSKISIDERDFEFNFIRSSGPGGQNVNKVSSAVQLMFDVLKNEHLPEVVKNKLIKISGKKITNEGILIIEAKRYRTQQKNREDAIERLIKLIKKAAETEKRRKKTSPSKQSKEKRIETKKKRSDVKKQRSKVKF